ncbi:MAG TPA: phosphate ABC transporter permease subunit PstC [Jatrophihabitans sp.]|nr:phosphate ABC transporter permease subunit PstC [Jatrophihabitans sp.]
MPRRDRDPAPAPAPQLHEVAVGSAQPLAVDTDDQVAISGRGPSLMAGGRQRLGDRVFATLTAGSGLFIVLLIALVAIFLVTQAIPAISKDHASFLFSRQFSVRSEPLQFGVLDLLWVTVISSVIALLLAVPVAVGIGLFITQYAHKSIRRPVAYVIDLLAAIPSIIYGIWGIAVLAPHLAGVQRALYHLDAIPLFANKGVVTGSIFNASVVLAVMILPIVTAIARDVFARTPSYNIEAAWALGATRWEMIRLAVLPYGRPGVVSGAMLGLGRALGETIAVLLILSKPAEGAPFTASIFNGGQTFASIIGLNMQEANGKLETGAYIAAGLVLFVLTFAVNAAARAIVNRRKDFV